MNRATTCVDIERVFFVFLTCFQMVVTVFHLTARFPSIKAVYDNFVLTHVNATPTLDALLQAKSPQQRDPDEVCRDSACHF